MLLLVLDISRIFKNCKFPILCEVMKSDTVLFPFIEKFFFKQTTDPSPDSLTFELFKLKMNVDTSSKSFSETCFMFGNNWKRL